MHCGAPAASPYPPASLVISTGARSEERMSLGIMSWNLQPPVPASVSEMWDVPRKFSLP